MIVGHFAMWAVRLSPYHIPDNLGKSIESLIKFIRNNFKAEIDLDDSYIFTACESKVRKALDEFAKSNEFVREWNKPKSGDDVQFVTNSRYDSPNPDDDIIDLDALVGDICRSLHQEVEKDEEFNKEFDEELEREQNR